MLGLLGPGFVSCDLHLPDPQALALAGSKGKDKALAGLSIVLLGLYCSGDHQLPCLLQDSGFRGMAYWTMIALTASGLVGRYFCSQIPMRIGGRRNDDERNAGIQRAHA